MKIEIKRTPEQVELIKLMGSKNRQKAIEAQETFAAAIGPVIQVVLQQAVVIGNLFKDIPYDEFSAPTIPLDLYYDVTEKGYIKTWSQTKAGGLATSQTTGLTELPVMTYNLTSAVSFMKDYARQGRLDVVAKTLQRMSQEILLKQEVNAVSVVLKALAEATFTRQGNPNTFQIIRTNTADQLVLDDFNKLLTLAARINSSWIGGTPVGAPRGLTDIVLSPEAMEEIRAMAYEPMNTIGDKTNIPGTDSFRDSVYSSAGLPSIYGVSFIPCYEMGVNTVYNTLFDQYAGSNEYPGHGGGAAAAFNGASEELLLGVDRTRDALVRPVWTDSENGGSFQIMPDDQFYASRSEKIGFWGKVREGRVVTDSRALVGLVM